MTTLYNKSNQDDKNEDDVYICTLSGNRITSVTIRDKEGSEACIRQMRATHKHVRTFRNGAVNAGLTGIHRNCDLPDFLFR